MRARRGSARCSASADMYRVLSVLGSILATLFFIFLSISTYAKSDVVLLIREECHLTLAALDAA